MFDIGFSELVVIAVVALIVIGPERLPKVARMAGALLGRLQRYANDVKAEVNREIHLDEIRKLQHDMHEQMKSAETQVSSEVSQVQDSVSQTIHSLDEKPAEPGVAASQDKV